MNDLLKNRLKPTPSYSTFKTPKPSSLKTNLRIQTKAVIIVSFSLSLLLVLFIALNANRHLYKMADNNSELYSAYKISELLKVFKSNLQQLEIKHRSYEVTGDPNFLNEYKKIETELKASLHEMEQYFNTRPEEENFYKLKALTYEKIINVKDLNQQSNLAGFQGKTENKNNDNRINDVIDAINSNLSSTTRSLIDDSKSYINVSKKWSILQIIIAILVSAGALFILLYDISLRNKLEKQLRFEKQRADQNADAKEQFMANMSHEIRTPMNAIVGFTHLLSKTALSAEQSTFLKAIETSGNNLLNLINDILDFSKIEAGKMTLERIPISLPEFLSSLELLFTSKANERKIHFAVISSPTVPSAIIGDPTRLTQILVNLINNAVKFTAEGSVTLLVSADPMHNQQAMLTFVVKDTGIGIDESKLDQIFDRFNQGNKQTTRLYGGTGLGLSIVKSLTELQNGTVSAKSKRGIGSEFTVKIPFAVAEQLEHAVLPVNGALQLKESPLVLLTEDNELNRLLATNYLTGFGCKVITAVSGIEAIQKMKDQSPDVVLMDIQMPEMDGYAATHYIRQTLGKTTPIIAMTAHVLPGEREKCLQAGMNDYLTKPFEEAMLFNLIQKHTTSSQSAQSIAKHTRHAQEGMVDFEEVRKTTRGKTKFLKEMIELFLQQNEKDMQTLETALKSMAFEILKATSHRMITSVGFMGLKPLIVSLRRIEQLSGNQTGIEEISEEIEQLKATFNQARVEFREELKRLHEN